MVRSRPWIVVSLSILGLVATNATILTMLLLKTTGWSSTNITPGWVVNNRSTISIVVQVLAQALGMILVTVLCATLNLSSRAKLTYGSFSLETVNMLNAMCGVRIDWLLSFPKLLVLIAFMLFSFVPAALWAGAITPVLHDVKNQATIDVPRYQDLDGIVTGSGIGNETNSTVTEQGIFTYIPEFTLQGLILSNAGQASSRDENTTATQSKMDNTNYRYLGRSYGIGATVGLRTPFADSTTQAYAYNETGLKVSSHCIYNSSSACYFEDLTPNDAWTLQVWNAIFMQPNSKDYRYIASAGQRDYQTLVVSSDTTKGVISENTTHYLTMMSPGGSDGIRYGRLNLIQCQLTYIPTIFEVTVNVTNNTISVLPQGTSQFENLESVSTALSHKIYNLGQLFASTQWASPIGDTLMNNVNNLAFARDEDSKAITNMTVLDAVSESTNAILDSIMQAFAGAQLVKMNDFTVEPVTITSQAIVLGETTYIYAVLAINTIVSLIFIFELVRTAMWKHTPEFDFMNCNDLIIAASGGTAISKEAALSTKASNTVRVMLSEDTDGAILVPARQSYDRKHISLGLRHRGGERGSYQLASRNPSPDPSVSEGGLPAVGRDSVA